MRDKRAQREEGRARLRAMPTAQREKSGARIADTLWTLPEAHSANTILLYASLPDEVPTDTIAAEARRRGIQLTYPRCLADGTSMTLHNVESEEQLNAIGRFGIREPAAECPVTEVAEIDIALIPGLAWDREGHRLGRGAGYYDRLLATPGWRALRCGIFFAVQEFPALPSDPWDALLDLVVTEGGVWRAANS